MLQALFFGLPVLIFASGIPLALKWVPPNGLYSFRTATTFASLDAWYRINAATGLALAAAGIVAGIVVLLLHQGLFALKPELRYTAGVTATGVIVLGFLIPVVIYANKF
jgi:SdpI/YfhL protein family